jgi:hypothetical protein
VLTIVTPGGDHDSTAMMNALDSAVQVLIIRAGG